ncbi:MAG: TetR/AcrR family transcriptional regulator [Clostridia bacterium]|nr:TetR/AcrR family transcriptional regulator [Clostridia bacterium]
MYKNCKTKPSISRQKEIESAFLNLLVKKHYEDLTVCEICEYAQIPRKAFYRYFEGKEGLLKALIEHTLLGYQDFYQNFKRERRTIKGELECFFAFWLAEPQKTLLKVMIKNSLVGHILKHSQSSTLISNVDANKFLPNETEKMRLQIFNFAISGLMTLMLDWFNNGHKETPSEMAEMACRLIQHPLFPSLDSIGIYTN